MSTPGEALNEIAAAREEQREACALIAHQHNVYGTECAIREMPLTATPLGDTIAGLRERWEKAERDEHGDGCQCFVCALRDRAEAAEGVQQVQEDRARELIAAAESELAAVEAVLDATRAERAQDVTRAMERIAELEAIYESMDLASVGNTKARDLTEARLLQENAALRAENAALLNAFPEYGATEAEGRLKRAASGGYAAAKHMLESARGVFGDDLGTYPAQWRDSLRALAAFVAKVEGK